MYYIALSEAIFKIFLYTEYPLKSCFTKCLLGTTGRGGGIEVTLALLWVSWSLIGFGEGSVTEGFGVSGIFDGVDFLALM